MDEWRILPYKKCNAFENMAIDEAVFQETQQTDIVPTLRFYGWVPPSVSIGYFQKASDEVNLQICRQNNYDVVRRPTGGKAVFHNCDLTYAITAKTSNPLFPNNILGTYKNIADCLVKALNEMKIPAKMTKKRMARNEKMDAFCFAAPSLHEIVVNGRKICGSAQVRSHGAFLQHGSLLMDFDAIKSQEVLLPQLDRERKIEALSSSVTSISECLGQSVDTLALCDILKKSIQATLKVRCVQGSLTMREEARKMELIQKYESVSWTLNGSYKK